MIASPPANRYAKVTPSIARKPGADDRSASSTCSGDASIDCGSATFGQPAKTFGVQNGDSPVANARAMNSTGGRKVDFASYGTVTAPESHGHAGSRNASVKIAIVTGSEGCGTR